MHLKHGWYARQWEFRPWLASAAAVALERRAGAPRLAPVVAAN